MEKIWIKDGKFRALTADEFKSLTDEEAIAYADAKSEHTLKGINESIQKMMSKEDFEVFKKELKDKDLDAKFKAYDEAFEKLQKSIQDKTKNVKENGFEEFEKAHKDFKKGAKFNIKANALRSSVANSTQAYNLPDVARPASPRFVLTELFTPINLPADNNGTITYRDWDASTITRAAAAVAEGGTFPESTASWGEYSISLEKVGDTIPVSEEFLNDVEFARAELEWFLENNVARKENQYLYNGTGTTPQISGIYTRVPAFNAAGYTGKTTTTPNILDLIDVLANEIENGKDGKYEVNFALISKDEYLSLKLAKDTTGRRIYTDDQLSGGKVKIYPSSFVTANTMVVGDSMFAKLYQNEAYNISVGLDGNDFTNDLMTMKAKRRMALLIREADKDGFLKVTDISAALTAITT